MEYTAFSHSYLGQSLKGQIPLLESRYSLAELQFEQTGQKSWATSTAKM